MKYNNKISYEQKKNRIGEVRNNNYGSEMKIIDYEKSENITIQFSNGYITKSTYANFKKGEVKNLYDKTTCNIGYIGEGKYQTSINHKNTKQYVKWTNMIRRCYNDKLHKRNPTYIECEVCDEWHNFQNFAEWYDENYYEIEGQKMELDKDILHKGNKIYSPENCVIVPHNINILFIKCDKARGNFPIGVYFYEQKKTNKFIAICNDINNKSKGLGYYNTLEEAFNTYKLYKEQLIKNVADKYKNFIMQCINMKLKLLIKN